MTSSNESDPGEPGVTHETRLFLLGDDGRVQPLAHERYVALARRQATAPEFAGRRFILVDWYMRLVDNRPQAVVGETCNWLVFDAPGRLDLHAAYAIAAEAAPTETQWEKVRALVFGGDAQPRQARLLHPASRRSRPA
ncbi:MAG: hypothetical protein ABIR56_11900 [Polaromonas sp.]